MRISNNIQKTITRFALLIIILVSLIAGSCSGKKARLDRKGRIPEKEFSAILADLYITDGLLTITRVRSWFPTLDSLSSYSYVIEKHGYTKEAMDKTMKYYFVNNPKGLIKIYDKVLSVLSEMESRTDKELLMAQGHVENFWPSRKEFSFPDPSCSDSTLFDIKLRAAGTYSFAFNATLFPDDQSVNPRITAYTCNPDSINTGKRKYIETLGYIKDGQPHAYTLRIDVPKGTIVHLRGSLYDYDNQLDKWGEHFTINNLSITYVFALI
jgi:hypothetical protein